MVSKPKTKPKKAPPILASSDVKEKLRLAAEAAGLSIPELADLIFESGVVPPKAKDGITEVYTLQDLGKRLFGAMQLVPKGERAVWYESLVPVQQNAVVAVLREQGYRTEVIARDLGILPVDVMRTWNNYASQLGAQVVGIRLDTIAGQIQLAAERAQEMAIAGNDHRSFWSIERDKVKLLQEIGIVDSAIRRVEVTHKLDDQQKAELEALAALQAKRDRRRIEIEEIKQVEVSGDSMPDDVTEDYDDDDDEDE